MKHSIYISLLLICISVNAQTNVAPKVPEVDSIFSAKLTGDFFFEGKQYIGEQFYNKDWTEGNILLSTGENIYVKAIKYNGLFDELIWLNTFNYGKFKLDKAFIDEFWFKNTLGDNTHFKRINVCDTINVHRPDIFVEVAVQGKVTLYIQRKISIVGSENVSKNSITYSYDNIEAAPKYYIKLSSNHYLTMNKVRRRAFLNLFPEKKKTISKIIRDNRLNIKIESDFIKVIELMNKEIIL